MKRLFIYTSIVLLLAASCAQNRKTAKFVPVPFPAASVPGMITDQNEAAGYLALHYWDGLTDVERTYPSDSLTEDGGGAEVRRLDCSAFDDSSFSCGEVCGEDV